MEVSQTGGHEVPTMADDKYVRAGSQRPRGPAQAGQVTEVRATFVRGGGAARPDDSQGS